MNLFMNVLAIMRVAVRGSCVDQNAYTNFYEFMSPVVIVNVMLVQKLWERCSFVWVLFVGTNMTPSENYELKARFLRG